MPRRRGLHSFRVMLRHADVVDSHILNIFLQPMLLTQC